MFGMIFGNGLWGENNMKKKPVLISLMVIIVIIGIFLIGSNILSYASFGSWSDSGNVVYYASNISQRNANAYTNYVSGSKSSSLYVSAKYIYHHNSNYVNKYMTSSEYGTKSAQVSFSCDRNYTSGTITATHTYTLDGITNCGSTTASYQK